MSSGAGMVGRAGCWGRHFFRTGTVSKMEAQCGPAGGPQGSELRGFIGIRGFSGAKEAP